MVKRLTMAVCLGMGLMAPACAEEIVDNEKVALEIGGDVVSSYIWRGQGCGGFSVQPSVAVDVKKARMSVSLWGSAELFSKGQSAVNMNEFDIAVSFNPFKTFTIGVTDYHFFGGNYFTGWRFHQGASHNLEANLGYDFGPVALSWNTLLTGPDRFVDATDAPVGKRKYSTYVEISAPWKIKSVDCSAAVGASLWDDAFSEIGGKGFNLCNISLSASKSFKHVGVNTSVICNPHSEKVYFVAGLSF